MKFADAYKIGSNYKLSRLTEFEPDFDEFPLGALIMYEEPKPNTSYTIGCDPSWGLGQDRSVIHVLKNGTLHQPDEQVAEFAADSINMHDLTPICYMLGNLYKHTGEDIEALMSVECNISDDIVHQLRDNYNYSNLFIWKFYDNIKNKMSNKLGWWTNARTRPKIIMKAVHYIKQGWWDIHSPWMINEMQTIEKLEDKARVEAASGHHDDMFMAGAIALWSAHDMEFNEFGNTEEVAKKRDRRFTEYVDAYHPDPKPTGKLDFANTACTYQDMLEWQFGDNN